MRNYRYVRSRNAIKLFGKRRRIRQRLEQAKQRLITYENLEIMASKRAARHYYAGRVAACRLFVAGWTQALGTFDRELDDILMSKGARLYEESNGHVYC